MMATDLDEMIGQSEDDEEQRPRFMPPMHSGDWDENEAPVPVMGSPKAPSMIAPPITEPLNAEKNLPNPNALNPTMLPQGVLGEPKPPQIASPLDRYYSLLQKGSGVSNKHGITGGLLKAADIAGTILAPNITSLIPGTTLNQKAEENRALRQGGEIAGEQQKEAEAGSERATANKANAETPEVAPDAASKRAYEAAQSSNLNAEAQERLNKLETQYGAAVHDAIQNGRDLSKDPKVTQLADAITAIQKQPTEKTQNDFEQYYSQYLKDNRLPDTAANRLKARAAYEQAGQKPTPEPGNYLPVNDAKGNTVAWVDPKSGHFRSVASIPGLSAAVGGGAIPPKPTAQTQNMAQMAQTVVPQAQNLLSEIDDMAQSIGPAVGRWNELLVNKGGKDFPEFAGLDTDLDLFASALVRTHFGARGGQGYREALKKQFSAAQSPEDLKSRIEHADTWLRGYANMGGAGAPETGGAEKFQVPHDAPPAPKEDGKLLKSGGKTIAKSKGGQWVQPQ